MRNFWQWLASVGGQVEIMGPRVHCTNQWEKRLASSATPVTYMQKVLKKKKRKETHVTATYCVMHIGYGTLAARNNEVRAWSFQSQRIGGCVFEKEEAEEEKNYQRSQKTRSGNFILSFNFGGTKTVF